MNVWCVLRQIERIENHDLWQLYMLHRDRMIKKNKPGAGVRLWSDCCGTVQLLMHWIIYRPEASTDLTKHTREDPPDPYRREQLQQSPLGFYYCDTTFSLVSIKCA